MCNNDLGTARKFNSGHVTHIWGTLGSFTTDPQRVKLKCNLDCVVSEATDNLLVIVLQTVDALARFAAALNALHLALTRPPVVFNLLHGTNHH